MSSFIYPIILHAGPGTGPAQAPYVTTLKLPQDKRPLAAILIENEGKSAQEGMYIFDGIRWRVCIPIADVSKAIINGDAIEVFYNLLADKTVPLRAIVYRNGIIITNTGILPKTNAVYAIRVPRLEGSGTVSSINGVEPDGDGNVELEPSDIGALPEEPTLDEGNF